MSEQMLLLVVILACACCAGTGYAIGLGHGWQTGFKACSQIWTSDENVLDSEEIS